MQDCIPTSLLKLSADNSTRAVKMFAGVQKYMAEGGEAPVSAAKAELVQKLLHQVQCLCVSRPSLPEGVTNALSLWNQFIVTSIRPSRAGAILPRGRDSCRQKWRSCRS